MRTIMNDDMRKVFEADDVAWAEFGRKVARALGKDIDALMMGCPLPSPPTIDELFRFRNEIDT